MRLRAVMILVAMLGAPPLRAQQMAYAANVGAELDSVTQAAVTREIAKARERGLPVEPLVAKVREGRLKRAAGTRIRSAVSKLSERLDTARAALGGESTVEELVAGAEAIGAGAAPASLRALRAATTLHPIAFLLGTLAQLVASGVPAPKAVEMITALLRKNAGSAQVLALGNQVETDVASGLGPEESASIRLRGIEALLPLNGDKVTVTASPAGSTGPPAPKGPPPPQRKP